LVKGVTDFLISDPALKNLSVIGPNQKCAQLEGSKAFAKALKMSVKRDPNNRELPTTKGKAEGK
jgi:phosphoribosylamine-glycine ligase